MAADDPVWFQNSGQVMSERGLRLQAGLTVVGEKCFPAQTEKAADS